MEATRVQHTPGPWAVSGCQIRAENTVPVLIATSNTSDNMRINGHSWEANAHLIAAAPELLGACKSALRALEDNLEPGCMDEEAKIALRLVIAKAEGRA